MKTKVRILLMSLVLMSTGCTQNVTVPEQYVAPEFLRIDYNVYSIGKRLLCDTLGSVDLHQRGRRGGVYDRNGRDYDELYVSRCRR